VLTLVLGLEQEITNFDDVSAFDLVDLIRDRVEGARFYGSYDQLPVEGRVT
jgi:hypothetical protein